MNKINNQIQKKIKNQSNFKSLKNYKIIKIK
jgi:hypothetical protein